eukprot:9446009-Pyramimonas_sp.AAC.1
MSGGMAPDLREAAQKRRWSEHQYYQKGIHAPVRFIVWNFNDIVDATGDLIGVGAEGKRQENLARFAGAFRVMVEAAERLVDDAVSCSPDGAIEIMCIGGDHRCWRSAGGCVNRMLDDVATIVRARMNRRIEDCKTAGIFPRIMILDGACLYRKLQHPQGDVYHFLSEHSEYKVERGGHMVKAKAAEMCVEHMFMAAKLAVLFFGEPSGGPA